MSEETNDAQDAARYRWLRSQFPGPISAPVPPGIFIIRIPESTILTEAEADMGIDAEMKKQSA